MMAKRMTRIRRMKTDFYPAYGVMGKISHELHKFSRIEAQTAFVRKHADMNEVNANS
jgi:hypothetical protein